MNLFSSPRVTVILPMHKDDGYFDLALKSVLDQSFDDFELIIVANNCSDALWQKLQIIDDKRVLAKRLYAGGLAFALNYGLSLARGEYVARMDADDICLLNRFGLQVDFLDKHNNVDVLGGRIKLINSAGDMEGHSLAFYEEHDKICSILPYKNPIVHPAVMVRRRILLENGGYKFGFAGEDYELWIRLMLLGARFHNLNDEILLYRRHDSQMTSRDKDFQIFSEISSMLLMYFIKNKDFRFLVGALIKIPFIRRCSGYFSKIKIIA